MLSTGFGREQETCHTPRQFQEDQGSALLVGRRYEEVLKIWKNMKPVEDREKRQEMLERFERIGSTVEPEGRPEGDCINFDLEKCLLLQSPGNLCPHKYLMFLRRLLTL
jgi:hypothetical protein